MAGHTGMAGWLRIFCAALLLSLGLAHKPAFTAPQSDPSDIRYRLPDGSYATICYGGEGGHHPAKADGWTCEACRIGADTLSPSPPADPVLAQYGLERLTFSQGAATASLALDRPGSPVRGPPFAIA